MTHQPIHRRARSADDPRALTAMAGLGVIGALGTFSFLPLVVSQAIAGLGLNPRAAGLLATAEMAAGGVATFLASFVVHRLDRRRIALLGLILIVAGSGISEEASHFAVMAFGRVVTGVGEGTLIAAVIASMAGTRLPERNFGLWTIANMVAASLLLYAVMPAVIASWGIAGVFGAYLCLALPGFALLAWYPHGTPAPRTVAAPASSLGAGAVLCLTAILLSHLAHGGIWAYMQRFGAASGISAALTARALGYAAFAGLLGGVLVTLLGTRWGRALPNAAALVLSAASALLVATGRTPGSFVTAAMCFYLAWVFGLPYLMGILAALDPQGRAATLGIVMQNIGLAAGPAGAGALAAGSQYRTVAHVGFGLYLLALLIIVPLAYRVDRGLRSSAHRPPARA
ncbi:MAG: MFS transporter [Steroidobacteraceae bacterium]